MTHPHDRKLTFKLTGKQYGALMCLLGVHNREPVMSAYDTEILNGLAKALEKQHDALKEAVPFEA